MTAPNLSESSVAAGDGFIVDGERWCCAGDLTFATAATVFAATEGLSLPVSGVIDCAGIDALDSAAVAVLVALKRRAMSEKKRLVFVSLPSSLTALIQLYDVEEVLVSV